MQLFHAIINDERLYLLKHKSTIKCKQFERHILPKKKLLTTGHRNCSKADEKNNQISFNTVTAQFCGETSVTQTFSQFLADPAGPERSIFESIGSGRELPAITKRHVQ